MTKEQEFEKEVIAGLIVDSLNIRCATDLGITPDYFMSRTLGQIFTDISKMDTKWDSASMVSVFHAEGLYDKHHILTELCSMLPEWAFQRPLVSLNIETLKSGYMGRLVTDAASSASQGVLGGTSPDEVLNSLTAEIDTIKSLGDVATNDKDAIIDETIDLCQRMYNGERIGLPFPWNRFQIRTGGIPLATYTPLLGRDGMGKSRLVTWMAAQWVLAGIPMLYMPYEDGRMRFFNNFAASIGEYDAFILRRNRSAIPLGFMENHYNILNRLRDMPIFVDTNARDDEAIANSIYRHVDRHGVVGVVIDGIKDVSVRKNRENQTQNENEITKTLTRVADKTNVAIIGISHPHDVEDGKWLSRRNIKGSKTQNQSGRMNLVFQDCGWPESLRGKYGTILDEDGICAFDAQKTSYGDPGIVVLKKELELGRFTEVEEQT